MSNQPSPPSGQILKAAGAMGAATFLSRIMGLVREQVFAYLFGAGNATDAFNVAFRIPNLLRDLFAEGAMSASLVATFTKVRSEEGEDRAWRVAGLVFRVLLATVGVLALFGMLFSPQLVGLYASAYKAIPGKFELTVRMTRIIFPFFPLVALAAGFMGILNACGVFFLPAFASALFNVASVFVGALIAAFLFRHGSQYGIDPIEGMAIGVVAGGFVQAFCQLPALYKKGYSWRPKKSTDPVWYQDPALKRMLWMMVPGTIGLAATQINMLVNTILATSQGPGAVSWLGYAFRLMQFPIGVFGVSLAAATLPQVSRLWVNKDVLGVKNTVSQSLRHVFAINLPCSAGLIFLGQPIIQLIFEYGRFKPEATQATAVALAAYSIGLTAYSAVKVLVPACYGLGNTRIPVISSFFAVALTIILNLIMIRPFGYWGLALGTSAAAILNSIFLLVAIRKLLRGAQGDFPLWPLFQNFLKNLVVSTLMGVSCYLTYRGLTHLLPEAGFIEKLGHSTKPLLALFRGFKVGICIFEAVLALTLMAKIFRLKDTLEIVEIFTGKLKKKLSQNRT